MQRIAIKFVSSAEGKSALHARRGAAHGLRVLIFARGDLLDLAGQQAADRGRALGGKDAHLLDGFATQAEGDVLLFVRGGLGKSHV